MVYDCLLYGPVIGLDLESHLGEKVQFFETRLRIIFLALAWRDEIEIIIWPFSYFETRTRFHFVTLMFRDEIETSENHFSWSSEKKWSWLSSRIPGIENSLWPLAQTLKHITAGNKTHTQRANTLSSQKNRGGNCMGVDFCLKKPLASTRSSNFSILPSQIQWPQEGWYWGQFFT